MRVLLKMIATLALCLLLAGCQTQLFGSLSESEANAVLAALKSASIDAEKKPAEEGAFAVFVDKDDFARAVRILEDLSLPQKKYDDLGKVFGKDAMFSTPMEEKARYLYAMQEELAHTVASIDGVLEARVHLVLPEQDQLGRELQTPSAAVFVKHVDDARHDPITHQVEIRKLVAAAVPSLVEDRIVVTFFPMPAKTEQSGPPPLQNVLGVRVAAESAMRLRWMLGIAAALCVILALTTAVFAFRRREPKE